MGALLRKLWNASVYAFTTRAIVTLDEETYSTIDYVGLNLENFRVFPDDTDNRMLSLFFWTEKDIRDSRIVWKQFVDGIKAGPSAAYKLPGFWSPMLAGRGLYQEPGNGFIVTKSRYNTESSGGPPDDFVMVTTLEYETQTVPYGRVSEVPALIPRLRFSPPLFGAKAFFDVIKATFDNDYGFTCEWVERDRKLPIIALTIPAELYSVFGAPDVLTRMDVPLSDGVTYGSESGARRADHLVFNLHDPSSVIPSHATYWLFPETGTAITPFDNDPMYLMYALGEVAGIEEVQLGEETKYRVLVGDDRTKRPKTWLGHSKTNTELAELKTRLGLLSIRVMLRAYSSASIGNNTDRNATLHSFLAFHNGGYELYLDYMPTGLESNRTLIAYLMLETPEKLQKLDPIEGVTSAYPVTETSCVKCFHASSVRVAFQGVYDDPPLWEGGLLPCNAAGVAVGDVYGGYFLSTAAAGPTTELRTVASALDQLTSYWGAEAPIDTSHFAGLRAADILFMLYEMNVYGQQLTSQTIPATFAELSNVLRSSGSLQVIQAGTGNAWFQAHARVSAVANGALGADSKVYDFRLMTSLGAEADVVSAGSGGVIVYISGTYYRVYPSGLQEVYGVPIGNGRDYDPDTQEVYSYAIGYADAPGQVTWLYSSGAGTCAAYGPSGSSVSPGAEFFVGGSGACFPQFLIPSVLTLGEPSIITYGISQDSGTSSDTSTQTGSGWDGDRYTTRTSVVAESGASGGASGFIGFASYPDGVAYPYDRIVKQTNTFSESSLTITWVDGEETQSFTPSVSSTSFSISGVPGTILTTARSSYANENFTDTWDYGDYVYKRNGTFSSGSGAWISTGVVNGVHRTFGFLFPPINAILSGVKTDGQLYNHEHLVGGAVPIQAFMTGFMFGTASTGESYTPLRPAMVFPHNFVLNSSSWTAPTFHASTNVMGGASRWSAGFAVEVGYTGAIKHLCDTTIKCKNHTPWVASVEDDGTEFTALTPGISYVSVFPANGQLPCVVNTYVLPTFVLRLTNGTAEPMTDYFFHQWIESKLGYTLIVDNVEDFYRDTLDDSASSYTCHMTTLLQGEKDITFAVHQHDYTLSGSWDDFANGAAAQQRIVIDMTREQYEQFPFHIQCIQQDEAHQLRVVKAYPVFLADATPPGDDVVCFVIDYRHVARIEELNLSQSQGIYVVSNAFNHIIGGFALWTSAGVFKNTTTGKTRTRTSLVGNSALLKQWL
jgi:hypothetical protein